MTSKRKAPAVEPTLRERAEERVDPPARTLTHTGHAHTEHELHVHRIELELQNEELRRAQIELDAARDRYFDLYELAPVGYVTLGSGGWIEQANLTASTLLAQPRGSLEHKGFARFIAPEGQDTFHLARTRLLATGEPQGCEVPMLRGDSTFWASLSLSVTEGGAGARVVRCTLSDVSARKAAESALHWNQSLLRQMGETAAFAFLVVDEATGLVLQISPNFANVWGLPLSSIPPSRGLLADDVGRACAAVARDGPSFVAAWTALHRQVTRTVVDDEIACKNGRTVRRHSSPLRGANDTYCGRFYLFEDITARLQNAEANARMERQLQEALKLVSIGRLAGGVAHDFNNMLGVILGHAEFAIEGVLPSESVHADLLAIQAAARRSVSLTRQLLAFARRQAVSPEVIAVNETVRAMLTLVQPLMGPKTRLRWRPQDDVWPIHVDLSQFEQLLTNLCVNARDAVSELASGEGAVDIETANCAVDESFCAAQPDAAVGDYVRLTVRDNGCGMGAETLSLMFEPFFTTKRTGAGTGLGLATVYGSVRQNRGFIRVTSQLGEGSSFEVYLPRHVGEAARAAVEPSGPSPRRGGETLLVVEDEPALLEFATRALGALGYTVLAAGSPAAALHVAEAHAGEIAMLITDVVMPGMNGRELATKLSALRPTMKCLFMSGYTADVIARQGVLDEGVSLLEKPFSLRALELKTRQLLDAPAVASSAVFPFDTKDS